MQQPNICEWKLNRLRESNAESYCAKCLKLESLRAHQGAPELCEPCLDKYDRFITREAL